MELVNQLTGGSEDNASVDVTRFVLALKQT